VERILGFLGQHALHDRGRVVDIRRTPLDPLVRHEELDDGRRQGFDTSTA
jgi:hypothetical protein